MNVNLFQQKDNRGFLKTVSLQEAKENSIIYGKLLSEVIDNTIKNLKKIKG